MMYRLALARIHHRAYGDQARAAAPAVLHWLGAAGIRGGLVVDLGCGSGILAARLASRGYDVVGVDPSAAMLRIARQVAPRARFLRARAEEVPLPRCAAVVATGEAITYLAGRRRPLAHLEHHVRRVARALAAGGLFVFDAIVADESEPMAYKTWQSGRGWAVLVDVREDIGRRIVDRHITIFTRAAGASYRRDDERHRVGVYRRAEVLALLRAHGFSVRVASGYGHARLLPRRAVFVARLGARAGSHTMR